MLTRPDAEPLPGDPDHAIAEQRSRLKDARAFVRVSATHPASLIAAHEWKARGPAAALAADVEAPLIDTNAHVVLDARDALASLPDTAFAGTPGNDVNIGFSLRPWVSFHDFVHQSRYWAASDGMRRFGLPELRAGGAERDLREELKEILFGVAFRLWSDLIGRAQATPGAGGLMCMPRPFRVPAEMDIHRKDLDRARGVPNRGGAWTTIGLRLDPAARDRNWLTVSPPGGWDTGWEDFIANLCHAMFGFEKPSWYYLPHFGAVAEATRSLPEARRRFRDGELPPGGQLMVRYKVPDDGFRWARVESWTRDDLTIVRETTGRELSPAIRPGTPIPVETARIVDWAVWVDGVGVVEGAGTECVGWLAGGAGDQAQSAEAWLAAYGGSLQSR